MMKSPVITHNYIEDLLNYYPGEKNTGAGTDYLCR
jgi:hypothetical protein